LNKKSYRKGAFNKLLGDVTIELIQVKNKVPKKIYDNIGVIGLYTSCFDVLDMKSLKIHEQKCFLR
jgi:hypothetical protein